MGGCDTYRGWSCLEEKGGLCEPFLSSWEVGHGDGAMLLSCEGLPFVWDFNKFKNVLLFGNHEVSGLDREGLRKDAGMFEDITWWGITTVGPARRPLGHKFHYYKNVHVLRTNNNL
jgi:hypothetical protein